MPLLLQMFVWYGVVLKSLPGPREAINISDMFFLSNRGLNMPDTIFGDSAWLGLVGLAAGIVGAIVLRSWARKRQAATGQPFPYVLTGIAMILALPVLGLLLAGWPITFDYPVLGRLQFHRRHGHHSGIHGDARGAQHLHRPHSSPRSCGPAFRR